MNDKPKVIMSLSIKLINDEEHFFYDDTYISLSIVEYYVSWSQEYM